MTLKELEAYLWGAANILRGLIDAADFKQYIFPLLFFKRISDLWDEEYQQAMKDSEGDLTYAEFGEQHRFQIPKGCHWEDVRKKTVNVGAALQKALNGIEKANFEVFHDKKFADDSGHAASRMRGLRLSTAHHGQPETRYGAQCDFVAAWRTISRCRERHTPQND